MFIFLLLVFSIGAVSATDLNDNSTTEISYSDVDDGSVLLSNDASNDNVEINQNNGNVLRSIDERNVDSWDELYDCCVEGSDNFILHLNDKEFVADSQITFNNNVIIIGSENSYFTVNNPNLIPFLSNGDYDITFKNVNFKDSNCDMLIQLSGNSKLENCTFTNITVGSNHKSVVYNTNGFMDITDCTFTNCTSSFGVITNYNQQSVNNVRMNVENCNFINNIATYAPGAINNCGILNVTNSKFTGNSARFWAGAIHTHCNAYTRILNSEFISNTAGWNGGALYSYSKLEVYNSTFTDNNCTTNNGGGAIGAYNYISTYNVTIENCNFNDNNNLCGDFTNESTTTLGRGGAISVLNGGYLNVHGSNFVHNSAVIGQAICAYNSDYHDNETIGGVPYLQVYNNTFINHTKTTNDTVFISSGNYLFVNNTFINSPQTIGVADNTVVSTNFNLLNTLCISEIKFNQPIVADSDRAVIENQWAMTGYDAQNSKNSPYVGLKEVGYVWNYTIGTAPSGNYYASPVIDENGDFYVLGGDKIWAFYKNGNLKWNIQAYNVRGLALDSKGYLIAPVKGNKLVVLNATTGTATGANIFQASSVYEPMIGEDGNIYVAGEYEYDGGFVPIVKYYNSTHYSSDGGYDYSYKSLLDVSPLNSAPIMDKQGNIWINSDKGLYCVNSTSGVVLANYAGVGENKVRPLSNGNVVFSYSGNPKAIYALTSNGVLWNTTLPDSVKSWALDNINNVLYVSTYKGIYKFNQLTGDISLVNSSLKPNHMLVDAEGVVYCFTASSASSLSALDKNGTLMWSFGYGGRITGSPAMDKDGSIYFTSNDGHLYVLNPAKTNPNMTVEAKNINVDDSSEIIAKLPSNAAGNVIFTVNNKNYTVAIERGIAKLNIEGLAFGTYDVVANFAGDIRYLPSENKTSFNVSKWNSTVILSVNNIKVGEDAVINIAVPEDVTGLVTVTIDGKSYTVLINNGKGSLTLSNLVANSYPITAKYDGNYKYTEGENTTALTVAKMSSAVNVTANNIKFGEEAVINIAVPNVSLGVATVVVNGKSYNVAIVDEKGVLNIYNLAAGDYNVDVTYLGDNKYLSSTNAANFTVSKVSDYNMTVDIADIVKGENATITVTIPEDGTGSVIVTINGTNYKGTVIKGIAKVIIPDLDEGTYKVVTFYTGDNKYDSMIVNGTITVNKNTITTLTMNNLVKYFGSSQRLVAKLADALGNPIANATVYFTINGKVHARITDENGTASIAIRLLPGEYKASALFNGTDDYDMAAVNASVLVKNTILGNDTTLYFRNGTQYVAKFLDGNGKALANTDVKFNINGVFYTRVTDENGIARLNIRLDPASYIITAYNPVTGEQKANNITVLPRIIAKDLSMKYLDGSTFNAALVDGQGKAISGVNITFNINGVFYHRTTDVNGVASLNIRLISGVYIITSMYDECWASNKITISA
ncbi:MAG: PQQ-binding-like beta-propeller repeat protein [Methanobrevibacter smithii]